MADTDYGRRRGPLAITGPVAWPVGEPPKGSRLTASVAPSAIMLRSSAGITSSPLSPGWKTPSDLVMPLPGTSQSSSDFSSGLPAATGTIFSRPL